MTLPQSPNSHFPLMTTLYLAALLAGPAVGADLQAYLRESLAAHPGLKADYEAYQAARERGEQVAGMPDPKLGFGRFLSPIETRTGPQKRTLTLSQEVPWPGKLEMRREVADAQAKTAFYRYEARRRQIIERVGLAYFDYAYLARATVVARENRELLQQLKPVVEEKVRGGGSLAEDLRLDVELGKANDQVQTLGTQRGGLSARLEAALGRKPNGKDLPFGTLPPNLPKLAAKAVLQERVSQHPVVEGARDGVFAADQALELAQFSKKPTLNFGLNVIDIGDGGDTAAAVTFGVSLPIWREKYRAEEREARLRKTSAESTVTDVHRQLLAELEIAYQKYEETRQRVQLYDSQLIPASRQAVELVEENFRNDKATLTDLIDTERLLLELRLARARALADAHQAAFRVRALTEPITKFSQ